MFRSRDINAPHNGERPNKEFGRIRQLESSGFFTRNSFEVSGEGSLFKSVRVNGRYRLSKAVDNFNGAFGLPAENSNLNLEQGASNLDQRHYVEASFDYEPFRDFRIMPSVVVDSPRPYTVTTGFDDNNDTVFNDRPEGENRNFARGSWSKNVNLGVNWSIPFIRRWGVKSRKKEPSNGSPNSTKYHRLHLSLYVNNLLNSTNERFYVGNKMSPFFGEATSAASSRSFRFGLTFFYF